MNTDLLSRASGGACTERSANSRPRTAAPSLRRLPALSSTPPRPIRLLRRLSKTRLIQRASCSLPGADTAGDPPAHPLACSLARRGLDRNTWSPGLPSMGVVERGACSPVTMSGAHSAAVNTRSLLSRHARPCQIGEVGRRARRVSPVAGPARRCAAAGRQSWAGLESGLIRPRAAACWRARGTGRLGMSAAWSLAGREWTDCGERRARCSGIRRKQTARLQGSSLRTGRRG